MPTTALTRRTLLQTAALTTVAAPFVHGAYAAGKLSVGVWDHWVPGANDMLDQALPRMGGQGKGRYHRSISSLARATN